jgi:hypothetical protein
MSDEGLVANPEIGVLLREGRAEEALRRPLRKTDRLMLLLGDRPGGKERRETLLYAVLTLGDFLYDYIRIDPQVVSGIDFARAEDLDSILSFARFAEAQQDLAEVALHGSVSQMQGYVAEQVVAHHLEAQGYDVTFPDVSNQEGWDVLVDGHPFQVKCLETAQGVHEHLRRFPDIPVYVNAELADDVGSLPGVHVDPLLHHDEIRHATEDALHHGAEVRDFEIPWISLAVSSALAVREMLAGDTDLQGAVTNALTNTAGRIGGGIAGEHLIGIVGLVFGPAGAVVGAGVGSIFGAYLGRKGAGVARRILTRGQEQALRNAAAEVADVAVETMPTKDVAWAAKRAELLEQFGNAEGNRGKVGSYLDLRIEDERRYFLQKRSELRKFAQSEAIALDPLQAWQRVLVLIRRAGVHPQHLQDSLHKLAELGHELVRQRKRYKVD